MPYSDTMMQIQDLLIRKWGAQIEADGFYGPATERAIYNALYDGSPTAESKAAAQERPANTTGTPAEQIPVLTHVPHFSQGAPLIKDILLGFPLTEQEKFENSVEIKEGRPPKWKEPDTCRKSGCLSTALWCCLAAQRDDDFPSVDSFIEHIVSCECYLNGSILHQTKACAEFGFFYDREISADKAKNYLRGGIPVIIQIRKPHIHFLVGLGYDVMNGYAVHDPGTQWGNFYKEKRYVASNEAVRFDCAIPDASVKAGA